MSSQRFRATAPNTPIETDEWGWPFCRQCKEPVPRGRLTFCSDACVYEWRIRTDSAFMREQVLKRDRGICARCRLDCLALRQSLIKKPRDCFTVATQWEAHHIEAVEDGGGECGLSNYETLCLSCHARETKLQRLRRDARTRRGRKIEILTYLQGEDFGASTAEIIKAVGISKSQVNEYLKVLRERNFVSQSKRGAPFFITEKGLHALSDRQSQ